MKPTVTAGRNLIQHAQAVVLCGGLGMRLKACVPDLPKSLAPIGGRPFLDYLLADLAAAGIPEVILSTGYGSKAIEEEYGNGTNVGLAIRYSVERESLGTGGALKLAQPFVHSNPFLLLNGDSLFQVNYTTLFARHAGNQATATLALARVPEDSRYAHVAVRSNGEIAQIAETPANPGARGASSEMVIYGGVCLLDRRIFEEIPPAPPPVSFEKEILPKLLRRGLFGELFSGFYQEIGVPDDYEKARVDLPRRYGCASTHTG